MTVVFACRVDVVATFEDGEGAGGHGHPSSSTGGSEDPTGITTQGTIAMTVDTADTNGSSTGSQSDTTATGTGEACEMGPPGVGPCPASCSGGCADGLCLVDCALDDDCAGSTAQCPSDWPCMLTCSDTGACDGIELRCGNRGCHVDCSKVACNDVTVVCGDGPCTADCTAGGGQVTLMCGAACSCKVGC